MKGLCLAAIIILTISLGACSDSKNDNIYSNIHNMYYDIGDYTAKCSVTAYNKQTHTEYSCSVNYDSKMESYKLVYDDMQIYLDEQKCIMTKGSNVIESPASAEDMYIFVNSFFKSYYQSEDTMLSVSANKSDTTLLECSISGGTDYLSYMKLWIDNKTVLPIRMNVYDKDGNMHTEIKFNSFKFL